MKGLIRLSGLLILGLAIIVPSFAGEDEKPATKKGKPGTVVGKEKDKDKSDDGDAKKEKFTYNKNYYLLGKLTQMDPNSQRDFTIQVKIPELNPDTANRMNQLTQQLAQQQQQLAQQQQQFAQARDINGKRNALNAINGTQQAIGRTQLEMVKAQANLYRAKDVDVKLRATETMKVRWKDPPPDYDDKGNLKIYTKEEKKALMDPGLPGYRGELDGLRTGQIVQVFLAKSHSYMQYNNVKSKAKGKAIPKKAKKVEDDDDEMGLQDRPEVVMIVILAEPQQK
jgi:hypothetical protein